MGNILKFPPQKGLKTGTQGGSQEVSEDMESAQIVDVTQRIQERQAEDRRRVKRVVLNEFIAAHVYVSGRGLCKIALKNVDEGGIAFDIDEKQGQFTRGETLEIRFYLNYETYFKFNIEVAHSNIVEEEGVFRHGCKFIGDSLNNVALHHFVQFLQTIAASLRTDKGDRIVSNIYS